MTHIQQFGEYLRLRREAKRITLHALAHRTQTSPAMISRIENGKHDPRLTTMHRIARRGFNQTVPEFLAGYLALRPEKVVPIAQYHTPKQQQEETCNPA